MDLTAAQGRVMGYLAHRDTPACSRDIEEAFKLSHPTVSGILSRLEKKNFIAFRPDEADHRCKRIDVLPKGYACSETMHRTITDIENRLVQGFTEQEKELFDQFLTRAIANLGAEPCQRNHKEEDNE